MEIDGPENNPEVMKYYHETGRTWVNSEETAWCDAFMDWCAMQAGYAPTPGLNARAWLDVGEVVVDFNLDDDIIAILWRGDPDGWRGHVGIPIRKTDKHLWLLGGNQSNMVRISPYPIGRLLGYRRLNK
jgi:uncharacterized protein (TIGR02594 family)